jgi:calmodulin
VTEKGVRINSFRFAHLGNILRNLGQNPTEAELQELVIQLDKDKNGTVEFEELLAIINGNLMESVSNECADLIK